MSRVLVKEDGEVDAVKAMHCRSTAVRGGEVGSLAKSAGDE